MSFEATIEPLIPICSDTENLFFYLFYSINGISEKQKQSNSRDHEFFTLEL